MTTLFILLVVSAVVTLAVGGCGSDSEESANAQEVAAQTPAADPARTPAASPAEAAGKTAAAVTGKPGGKGSPAPDFTLKNLDGSNLQLSSLRGKAVIVDFWDTWCPPCRKAMPHLQELSVEYSDELVVVGVALGREGEDKVRKFTQDRGLTFEMVMFNNDPQLIKNFGGIPSIPTTFLIDGDGVIREKWVGGFGKAEYERALKAVLGS